MSVRTDHPDGDHEAPRPAATAVRLVLFALCYGVATCFGEVLPGEPTSFAAFWPGSGVLLAALLLAPPRRWWVYALLVVAISIAESAFVFGKPVWAAAAFGLGDTAEAVLAAWLYRRWHGPLPPDLRLRSFLGLALLAAPAGVLLGGLINGTTAWLATGGEWHRHCLTEAIGDYLGVLIVGTLILAFASPDHPPHRQRWRPARLAEGAALAVTLVAASWAVFSAPHDTPLAKTYPIYLAFLWLTLRFDLRAVALGSVALAGVAVWFGSRGKGPMIVPGLDPWSQVLLLQVYLCSSALTYLSLAALHAEQTLADARLRQAARFSDAVFENAPVAIRAFDAGGHLVRANQASRALDGLADGEAEHHRACAGEVVWLEGQRGGAGGYFDQLIYPVRDDAGSVVAVVSFARDVTTRIEAEERLRAALRERETLLQEVHHRVKNNLAITVSLLNLQIRKGGEVIAGPLREAQGRVRAMALVHELLYRSGSLATLPLREYVGLLVRTLVASFSTGQVRAEVHADEVPLSLDAAVPFGLILNELVCNAFEHAFPDGRRGTLTVSLTTEGGRCHLAVADDGEGMPPELDPFTTDSLGLRLVRSLTQQLGGTLEVVRGAGTTVHVRFPDGKGA